MPTLSDFLVEVVDPKVLPVDIPADCCVKILRGNVPPPTVQDTVQLGHDAVHEHFRLSCQTKVIDDCAIMAMPPRSESGHQILASDEGVDATGMTLDSGVEKQVVAAKAPVDRSQMGGKSEL